MRSLSAFSLIALLAVGGCTMVENPMQRPGTWHLTGANADNLAVMVANPEDLAQGRKAGDVPGAIAVLPIEALAQDKVKKLPADELSLRGGSGGSSGAGTP